MLDILPFETAFIAISYVSLSQVIQKARDSIGLTRFRGGSSSPKASKRRDSSRRDAFFSSMKAQRVESSLVEWLEKQFEAGKGLYEAATDPSKSLVGPDVGISVVRGLQ